MMVEPMSRPMSTFILSSVKVGSSTASGLAVFFSSVGTVPIDETFAGLAWNTAVVSSSVYEFCRALHGVRHGLSTTRRATISVIVKFSLIHWQGLNAAYPDDAKMRLAIITAIAAVRAVQCMSARVNLTAINVAVIIYTLQYQHYAYCYCLKWHRVAAFVTITAGGVPGRGWSSTVCGGSSFEELKDTQQRNDT